MSFTRACSHLISAFIGTELPQAGQLEDPEKNFLSKKRPAQTAAPSSVVSNPRKRRKNRNKNSFSALESKEDEPIAEAETGASSGSSASVSRRPALVLAMMREKTLREALLKFLADLLLIPDPETVTRALVGLTSWSAQLWNMVIHGEDLSSLSLGTAENHRPEVGEILHTAGDVLRVIPKGLLQPLCRLATRPASEQFTECLKESLLEGMVRHPWNSFSACSWLEAKRCSSSLICELTCPIFTALTALVRLFKLQCRKLEVSAEAAQLYLTPALVEALRVLAEMPNTSQDDVDTLLVTLLDDKKAFRNWT